MKKEMTINSCKQLKHLEIIKKEINHMDSPTPPFIRNDVVN